MFYYLTKTKMKRKQLLSFAAVSAMMATMLMPSAFATTDSSSTTVTVEEDSTLTISLGSEVSSVGFTATAGEANDIATDVPSNDTNGRIAVTDYTGASSAGHYFDIAFDTGSWVYSGSAGGNNLSVTSAGTPGNDEIQFSIDAQGTGSFSVTERNINFCTVDDQSDMTLNDVTVGTTETTWGSLVTEDCPAIYNYQVRDFDTVGPADGYAVGTYTIDAVVGLYDGAEA